MVKHAFQTVKRKTIMRVVKMAVVKPQVMACIITRRNTFLVCVYGDWMCKHAQTSDPAIVMSVVAHIAAFVIINGITDTVSLG